MMYPLVRELAADGIPVTVTCRVLELCPPALLPLAGRPDRRPRPRARRTWPTPCSTPTATTRSSATDSWPTRLATPASRVRPDGVADLSRPTGGGPASAPRRAAAARSRVRRCTTTWSNVDFRADGPNQLWLTDITEHRTSEGKLYLCAVKDVFSGRIVGYSIADRMKARIAVDAIASAVARRAVDGAPVSGCIVHSDRGSQGGFNWSSQHLERGGDDGSASWVDVCVDGKVGDEVAGRSGASEGGGAGVLASDR